VTLSPLSEDDVLQLIRELGRVDAPTDGRRLAARIHEVTAGNPFYVVELLKTFFAQGLLTIDSASGAWIVPQSALTSAALNEVAPTVHDTVSERIECLPDTIHAVLISIAASGRGCRTDVLSHLHGISRLHAAMLGDALVERHLATEEEDVYRCAHPTIAHVVRARLSTSRRREVHRALALTLELLSSEGNNAANQAGEIATHAEQAGEQAMTYKYALLASEAAVVRAAFDEALSWLDVASGSAASANESDVVNQITARVLEQAGWPEAPAARTPVAAPRRVLHQDLDLPVRA
jgi:predicted ATPase